MELIPDRYKGRRRDVHSTCIIARRISIVRRFRVCDRWERRDEDGVIFVFH